MVGLVLGGMLRTGAAGGRHPKVPCGWNLRGTARGHDDRLGQPVTHVRLPSHPRRPHSHDLSSRLVLSLEDVAAWSPCSFWLNVPYGRNALTMRSRRLPDIRHPADVGSASVTSRKQPGSSSRSPWSRGRSGSSTARRNGKTMPAEDASAFDVQCSRRQLRRADRSRIDDLVAVARR